MIIIYQLYTASAATFYSLMMFADTSRRRLDRFVPVAAVIVEGETVDVETLVDSDTGEARAFLVVSWLMSASRSLSLGIDFLFLGGSSMSPSDLSLSCSKSNSDELQMSLSSRGSSYGNVKNAVLDLAMQKLMLFAR